MTPSRLTKTLTLSSTVLLRDRDRWRSLVRPANGRLAAGLAAGLVQERHRGVVACPQLEGGIPDVAPQRMRQMRLVEVPQSRDDRTPVKALAQHGGRGIH